jgi:hypothetical protein
VWLAEATPEALTKANAPLAEMLPRAEAAAAARRCWNCGCRKALALAGR